MKSKLTVVALLASAAGFAAGLLGSNLFTPAYAAGNSVILVKSNAALSTQCDFGKTIVISQHEEGYLCVKK